MVEQWVSNKSSLLTRASVVAVLAVAPVAATLVVLQSDQRRQESGSGARGSAAPDPRRVRSGSAVSWKGSATPWP